MTLAELFFTALVVLIIADLLLYALIVKRRWSEE
jgi:hypothetical protein